MSEDQKKPCCCGDDATANAASLPKIGENDALDLEVMKMVLKSALEQVSDPNSGWRTTFTDIQQLRKYVKWFVAEQLRSEWWNEPHDPTQDPAHTHVVIGERPPTCQSCLNQYYACIAQGTPPSTCLAQYNACVNTPCI